MINSPPDETPADYSMDNPTEKLTPADILKARIEALLFVSPGIVGVNQLAQALEVKSGQIEAAVNQLKKDYESRGLRLQTSRLGFQLTSAPEHGEDVERFLELESTSRLSRAALETLAIIAYEQPVTRPQIDALRGVRTLLRHGIVEELERSEGPGRPILYGTTSEFLQFFGLDSIESMPSLQIDADEIHPQDPTE